MSENEKETEMITASMQASVVELSLLEALAKIRVARRDAEQRMEKVFSVLRKDPLSKTAARELRQLSDHLEEIQKSPTADYRRQVIAWGQKHEG